MSEVTELTNEQFVEHVRDWGCTCDLLNGYDCGHGQITGELLRRLSTQGAGPRPTVDRDLWFEMCERVIMYVTRPEAVGMGESDAFLVNVLYPIAKEAIKSRAPSDPDEHGREVKR